MTRERAQELVRAIVGSPPPDLQLWIRFNARTQDWEPALIAAAEHAGEWDRHGGQPIFIPGAQLAADYLRDVRSKL